MMRLKLFVAAALIAGGSVFAAASGVSALPHSQLDKLTAAEQAPVVQASHRKKYKKKRYAGNYRGSRYCHYNPWDCRPRYRVRRSCYYDYYGDLVCGRRYARRYVPYPFFGWGFGFGF